MLPLKPDTDKLKEGDLVVLTGLVARSDLNGSVARILKTNLKTSAEDIPRHQVTTGNKSTLSVKSTNLVAVICPPPAIMVVYSYNTEQTVDNFAPELRKVFSFTDNIRQIRCTTPEVKFFKRSLETNSQLIAKSLTQKYLGDRFSKRWWKVSLITPPKTLLSDAEILKKKLKKKTETPRKHVRIAEPSIKSFLAAAGATPLPIAARPAKKHIGNPVTNLSAKTTKQTQGVRSNSSSVGETLWFCPFSTRTQIRHRCR